MIKNLKNTYTITLFTFLIVFSFSAICVAQESGPDDSEPQIVAEESANTESLPQSEPVEAEEQPELEQKTISMKAGPKLKELEEYTAVLLNGLEPAQAQYIYNIRQEFGIIRSVQVVRTDVEKAVESCSTENPDIKEKISGRFQAWNDTIVPKLAVADVALKDAIQRQTFRPTVRVSMLLDHVQEAFEERDAQIKKVPVTSLDSCNSLLASMDTTEENLQKLLDETIVRLNELSAEPKETASAS